MITWRLVEISRIRNIRDIYLVRQLVVPKDSRKEEEERDVPLRAKDGSKSDSSSRNDSSIPISSRIPILIGKNADGSEDRSVEKSYETGDGDGVSGSERSSFFVDLFGSFFEFLRLGHGVSSVRREGRWCSPSSRQLSLPSRDLPVIVSHHHQGPCVPCARYS